jgi:hypothetical protein
MSSRSSGASQHPAKLDICYEGRLPDEQELVPTDTPYPRPTNGIFVAITVIN